MSFPIMRPKEIVSCLKEIQMTISEDVITQPQPDTFARLCEEFMIKNELQFDTVTQMQFCALETFEYPELHEYSVNQLAFHRELTTFAKVCGLYDFGLRDLLHPEPARVTNFLSAAINFLKFRQDNNDKFFQLVEESEMVRQSTEEAELINRELSSNLQELTTLRELEKPHLDQIVFENSRLQDLVRELRGKYDEMKKTSDAVKESAKELQDTIASDQFLIMSLQAEKTRLQGQIVQSPEKTKAELVKLHAEIEADNVETQENHQKMGEYLSKYEGLGRALKDMTNVDRILSETATTLAKTKILKKEKSGMAMDILSKKAAKSELSLQEQNLRTKLQYTQARLQETDAAKKVRYDFAQQNFTKVKNMCGETEKDLQKHMLAIETTEADIRKIAMELARVEQIHEEKLEEAEKCRQMLATELDVFHQTLEAELQAVE